MIRSFLMLLVFTPATWAAGVPGFTVSTVSTGGHEGLRRPNRGLRRNIEEAKSQLMGLRGGADKTQANIPRVAYAQLAYSITSDLVASTLLKKSNRFRDLPLAGLAILSYFTAVVSFGLAIEHFPLSIAYLYFQVDEFHKHPNRH